MLHFIIIIRNHFNIVLVCTDMVPLFMASAVMDLGLDKEGTFCPTHQNLEGHLKN